MKILCRASWWWVGAMLGMALSASHSRAQPCPGMQDLDTLGGTASEARGVSADGSVVVGTSYNAANHERAFRWTAAGGMQNLGTLGGTFSKSSGVSADGSVVVGFTRNAANQNRAFRWTAAGGMQDLGTLGGTFSEASGVSADGSVVVGEAYNAAGQFRAFRWTAGGMQDLGALGGTSSRSSGVSADGSVVVGYASNAAREYRAFRWTAAGRMQDLGLGIESGANSVSADGSVVVGWTYNAAGHYRAFRWTAAGGMQDLGTLGGTLASIAHGASAGGSVVVGLAYNAAEYGRAFRWTAAGGMQDLGTLGGTSSGAYGVSADGSVVVGVASNAAGQGRAFRWGGGDTDGDGLLDGWECNGIPYTDAGGFEQRYILPGANPLRKDLYIEVDAMEGRAPSLYVEDAALAARITAGGLTPTDTSLDMVVGSFLNSGIALHIDINAVHLARRDYPGGFVQFQEDKAIHFGTAVERSDAANWPMMREAKRKAFRYCIFANTHSGGRSSGKAEFPGDDFMVTLGTWFTPGGTAEDQAGTFMHELGHTLGLGHGGADGIRYKPNYFSVMNYAWQYPTTYMRAGSEPGQWGRYFPNYSDRALAELNEEALVEDGPQGGIRGNHPEVMVPYSIAFGTVNCTTDITCTAGGGCVRYAPFRGPVDWDNDCSIDPLPLTNAVDITNVAGDTAGIQVSMPGFNDWLNLKYNFRDTEAYADGAVAVNTPIEMDADTYAFLQSLPAPARVYCSADFDNDGDLGTDADIEAYFACLGGNCCPTCGSADFNADENVGTDLDIETFFRVLGGGPC